MDFDAPDETKLIGAHVNPCWIHWLRLGHSHLRDGQSDTVCDSTPTTLVAAAQLVASRGSEVVSKTSIPGLAWT